MKPCEIYHVPLQGLFAWKWRHRQLDGRVLESKETYALYYECVSAALRLGYQPPMKCFAPGDGALRAAEPRPSALKRRRAGPQSLSSR